MKKQQKQFIIVAVILVIIAACYFILSNTLLKDDEKKDEVQTVKVADKASITSVSYNLDKLTIKLIKKDGTWFIENREDLDINQKLAEQIADSVASVQVFKVIDKPDGMSDYGMSIMQDNSSASGETNDIEIGLENGDTKHIHIGKQNPYNEDLYYMMTDEYDKVYIISNSFPEVFTKGIDDLKK